MVETKRCAYKVLKSKSAAESGAYTRKIGKIRSDTRKLAKIRSYTRKKKLSIQVGRTANVLYFMYAT